MRAVAAAVLSLMVMTSCGTVRLASSMKTMEKEHPYILNINYLDTLNHTPLLPFSIEQGRLRMVSQVDSLNDTLLLDLGYSGYLLGWQLDDSIDASSLHRTQVLTGRGLEPTYMHMEQRDVSNRLFNADNMLRMVLHYQKDAFPCDEPVVHSTLLGNAFIDDCWLVLNFENNTMGLYASVDKSGWVKLKSRRVGCYFVTLTIDGKRYRCMLDTGNPSGIVLKKDLTGVVNPTDLAEEGYGVVGASGHKHLVAKNGKQPKSVLAVHRNGVAVVYGEGRDTVRSNVRYDRSIAMNNAGLQFMRQFNWIIGKDGVYVQPVKRSVPPYSPTYLYQVNDVNGRLTIVSRWLGNSSVYQLGEVIVSVDGVAVNKDNICHFKTLLNTTADWSKFRLETR